MGGVRTVECEVIKHLLLDLGIRSVAGIHVVEKREAALLGNV